MALAALIVALAALVWNVISTAYSWRFSRPDIKVSAGPTWENGKGTRLDINVKNQGGSPVAVESVCVYWWFENRKTYSRFKQGWQWPKLRLRPARTTSPRPLARSSGDPDFGPSFPCTIPAYHSQKWSFNLSSLIIVWWNTARRTGIETKDFLIRVDLSNGKSITHTVDASGIHSYLLSWDGPDVLAGGSAVGRRDVSDGRTNESSGLGWPEA